MIVNTKKYYAICLNSIIIITFWKGIKKIHNWEAIVKDLRFLLSFKIRIHHNLIELPGQKSD